MLKAVNFLPAPPESCTHSFCFGTHILNLSESQDSQSYSEKFCNGHNDFLVGLTLYRPPPRGRFGRRSRRNSYDFALSVREGEDDFAPFFGDFRNLLSVLLAPVSRFFACLRQTLTVALMIANGDTPTTTRCLQKHDIITLIGNYP